MIKSINDTEAPGEEIKSVSELVKLSFDKDTYLYIQDTRKDEHYCMKWGGKNLSYNAANVYWLAFKKNKQIPYIRVNKLTKPIYSKSIDTAFYNLLSDITSRYLTEEQIIDKMIEFSRKYKIEEIK